MIDRVWSPRVVACGRSVSQGHQAGGRWRRGVWGSRPQNIFVTTGARVRGCSAQAAAAIVSFCATGCSIGASACSASLRMG